MSKPARTAETIHAAGIRLRVLRIILDIEQQAMSASVGAVNSTWNNWEKGRNLPDVLAMTRAATLYGFSLDWIYLGDPSGMRQALATEALRRVPDLVRGAPPGLTRPADWEDRPSASGRWKRRAA